jgi:hypothetical protein
MSGGGYYPRPVRISEPILFFEKLTKFAVEGVRKKLYFLPSETIVTIGHNADVPEILHYIPD